MQRAKYVATVSTTLQLFIVMQHFLQDAVHVLQPDLSVLNRTCFAETQTIRQLVSRDLFVL